MTDQDRSELFEYQTEWVETASLILNQASRELENTIALTAPSDWDFDRWCKANDDLKKAITIWQKTYEDWVIAADEQPLR